MYRSAYSDDAVSPVIGVILMVAITVILAAVIAAAVFSMSGDAARSPKNIAINAERIGTSIIFTNHGGDEITQLASVQCWINGTNADSHNCVALGTAVGSTAINANATTGRDRVIVIGSFYDSSVEILLDTWL